MTEDQRSLTPSSPVSQHRVCVRGVSCHTVDLCLLRSLTSRAAPGVLGAGFSVVNHSLPLIHNSRTVEFEASYYMIGKRPSVGFTPLRPHTSAELYRMGPVFSWSGSPLPGHVVHFLLHCCLTCCHGDVTGPATGHRWGS